MTTLQAWFDKAAAPTKVPPAGDPKRFDGTPVLVDVVPLRMAIAMRVLHSLTPEQRATLKHDEDLEIVKRAYEHQDLEPTEGLLALEVFKGQHMKPALIATLVAHVLKTAPAPSKSK